MAMKGHRPVTDLEPGRHGHATSWRGWVFIVGLAMEGILPAFASGHAGDNPARLAVYGAFAALVIAWVSVALHELGHAVASALVGGPVRQVRIGSGPLLRIQQAFGAEVVLRLLPTDGCTISEPPTDNAVRARLTLRAGAGLFVNAALIGIALTMLSGYWALMIVLVNGFMLVGNLLPHTARIAEGSLPSDGLFLVRLLRMPAAASNLAARALPTPMSRPISGRGPVGGATGGTSDPELEPGMMLAKAPSEANGGPKVERFTDLFSDRARRVVVLGQEEARLLKHERTGAEHLLLGLSDEREGIPARLLASLDIAPETIRGLVEEIGRPGRRKRSVGRGGTPPTGPLRLTPQAKQVLLLAHRESRDLGHDFIGPEHLLLGLLQETDGVVIEVLVRLGIDRHQFRSRVVDMIERRAKSDGSSLEGIRPKYAPTPRSLVDKSAYPIRTSRDRS